MSALERVRDSLTARGSRIESQTPERFMAQCPSHEDGRPSLSVKQGDRGVLLYCFAGCQSRDIAADLGLTASDLFDADRIDYRYRDREGRTVRTVKRTPGKDFPQAGKTKWERGTSPLYRLPEVLQAVASGEPVYFAEGEKDVEHLILSGVTATTTAGGASSPHFADFSPLAGAEVRLVPDQDPEGTRYAERVRGLLEGIARSVTVWRVREGKDYADHFAAGFGVEDLEEEQLEDREDTEQPTRWVVLTRASSLKPKAVHWLWKGRLPKGTFSVLAGREDLGKSTLTAHLVAQITRGRLEGESEGVPERVLWCTTEDDPELNVVPRLTVAGADLDRVEFMALHTIAGGEGPPVFPQDLVEVERSIRKSGAVLVVIDPLVSVLDSRINTNSDHSIRQALDPLSKLARDTGATVLALTHVGKSRQGDFSDRVLGSRGLVAACRSLLALMRDPSDPEERRLCLGVQKSNYADKSRVPTLLMQLESANFTDSEGGNVETSRIAMLGATDRRISDLLADTDDEADNEERTEAEEWLRGFLLHQGGEAPVQDIMKACQKDGISFNVLKKRKKRLGITSSKKGAFQGASMWVLPEAQTSQEAPAGNGDGPDREETEEALERDCAVPDCDSLAGAVVPLDGKRWSLCLSHSTDPALPLLLGGQKRMDATA